LRCPPLNKASDPEKLGFGGFVLVQSDALADALLLISQVKESAVLSVFENFRGER
jgi:hypothetical protein